MIGHMRILMLIVCFMLFISLACESEAQTLRNSPTQNMTRGWTVIPSFTYIGPTRTPVPIRTLRLTITPWPTLLPGAVYCGYVVDRHRDDMTDLQWEAVKDDLRGRLFYFSGDVENVGDYGSVFLNSSNDDCTITLYDIPQNIAIKLNKGQCIEGYGTIDDLSYTFVYFWI